MNENLQVLLVEDETLIAMDLQDELADHGIAATCAHTVESAEAAMHAETPAAAILDMHLKVGTTFDFATKLKEKGLPFFFLSGNGASALPPHLAEARILTKPVRINEVLTELRNIP